MEQSVLKSLWDYDKEIRFEYGLFCGVDEAGRGPLAGDVFAAAVILPDGIQIDGINDSKKLSEKKREILFDIILKEALDYKIAVASVSEIDTLNILGATMLAMERAVFGLINKPNCVLVDGNKAPELNITTKTVIKGDMKSASIAAASILAKVTRDRYMAELAIKYPEFLFEKHKGYGTKLHFELIEKHGLCSEHRRSFLKRIIKND